MKRLSIVLLFICSSYASANECIAKSDVESLIMTFKNNDKQSLIDMAVDSVKPYIENDLLIKNKISTLVNISESYYGWGEDRKSKYPVNTSTVFPNAKVCVWNVSFALPESMRKQCDDDGAYGYYIEFKKVNGKTVLYSFTSLFDSLPDGTLACKAANKFMLQK